MKCLFDPKGPMTGPCQTLSRMDSWIETLGTYMPDGDAAPMIDVAGCNRLALSVKSLCRRVKSAVSFVQQTRTLLTLVASMEEQKGLLMRRVQKKLSSMVGEAWEDCRSVDSNNKAGLDFDLHVGWLYQQEITKKLL